MKVDRVNTIVFKLREIKRRALFFFGTPGTFTFLFRFWLEIRMKFRKFMDSLLTILIPPKMQSCPKFLT